MRQVLQKGQPSGPRKSDCWLQFLWLPLRSSVARWLSSSSVRHGKEQLVLAFLRIEGQPRGGQSCPLTPSQSPGLCATRPDPCPPSQGGSAGLRLGVWALQQPAWNPSFDTATTLVTWGNSLPSQSLHILTCRRGTVPPPQAGVRVMLVLVQGASSSGDCCHEDPQRGRLLFLEFSE